MTSSDSPRPKELGGLKYAPPEAMRLSNPAAASGFDCLSGTGAKSQCNVTGSDAQACVTGTGTTMHGECNTGYSAGNCRQNGSGASRQ